MPRLELSHCPHPGECNTDVHINNCEPENAAPAATGSNGPRTHMNRDNDVYKRVPCPMPAPPPAPKPPPPLPFLPGGVSGGLTSNDSNGSSDSPAGIIILVLFLVLAAAAAAVVVYKGWAKPIARSVAMWVLRGDKDLSAHMRHHDSARAGSTAPVQAAGSWQHPICGVPCKEALPRMTEVKEALAVGTARTAL